MARALPSFYLFASKERPECKSKPWPPRLELRLNMVSRISFIVEVTYVEQRRDHDALWTLEAHHFFRQM